MMGNETKYLLRIDDELKQYLARQARLNYRSLNKEIIFRLNCSISGEKKGGQRDVTTAPVLDG